ncbi:cholecystokinin-like [Arapaima gigas]
MCTSLCTRSTQTAQPGLFKGPALVLIHKLSSLTHTLSYSLSSASHRHPEAVMNSGICVCVLLAALSSTCLGRPHYTSTQDENRPSPSPQVDASLAEHQRHARSVSLTGPKSFSQPEVAVDPAVSLNELLSRLMSRKGTIRRNSTVNSRAAGNHRIKDYQGWMDFGRRSAEEYEYTS